MKRLLCALSVLLAVSFKAVRADNEFWDEDQTFVQDESLRREIRYVTHSRPSGWVGHRWSLNYSVTGRKIGIFFVKNQYAELSQGSQVLGFHGSRDFKRIGFQAGYAQAERFESQVKGIGFLWGGLRLTPAKGLDLLARLGQTQRTFALPREEDDLGSFSAGFRLKTERSFGVRFMFMSDQRMNLDVAYRW